ncbi:Glycosyltransferase family 92 protein F13G3.3 [Amphibalanus amphitrite]|uniref:Glycosyltransferase family 92 protein n=1 Tax=Amphibalanus amphitrite TaxID=1232801 RepID=A0A6A4XAZ5_AMPAM|nr:uncharacterized protein LOC122371900 [Amphibalanus amphitrite]KAF0311571.1 Glycosyltransferase family 92 protein F13G3.3 [Amphibalanus amphitrite]
MAAAGRRRLLPLLVLSVLLVGVALLLLELLLLSSSGPAPSRLPPPPPPPPPPAVTTPQGTDAQWVAVTGAPHKLLVYSAFLDRRRPGGPTVVVVGATVTSRPAPLWCRVHLEGGRPPLLVDAEVKNIRENWNLKYSAVFVLCPMSGGGTGDERPVSVTVTAAPREDAHNRLLVQNREPVEAPSRSIGVCVKPLHFRYDAVAQLVEFIELQKLLGVDRFMFYNSSVGPRVDCALRWYGARGGVTVLPWRLDLRSQRDIRTEGMFAALNDCLLRSLPVSSHLAMLDLDEAIVPRMNASLHGLLDALENGVGSQLPAASYSFQNTFFYLGWPDDASAGSALTSLAKTRRRTYRHPHGQRSKYLAVPQYVLEAGNHFVWQTVPGHGTVHVAPAMATLHHYRQCEFGGQACLLSPNVRDTGTHWLGAKLKKAVAASLVRISDSCPKTMAVNEQDWRSLIEAT